ncbi:hypothetical protein V474_04470 [Novosphingobium barchaimii LL02]|uniref:Uncharacterized protein n=3 Tax=Sphingomonadaceae TaxID=41297 RepID=A0A0J7XHI2_9SPHN|nr:hypothetical protein SIDU_11280 [Sphingobium indicum B90A]KMS51238.1 hypothetical protein V473_11460 [Sphingobium cupriresistens LL01]KMS51496.1 hypothetical protein V474_04470 [Novosphingobium barchaimii LL02]
MFRHIEKRRGRRDAGIVDKDLDRAELVLDPCDGRINAGPIGNIERYGKCFAALVGNRLCRVRDPVDAARREGDMCAVRREQQSEMAPKTARCAGHQCDTVLERIYFGHDHRSCFPQRISLWLPRRRP